MNILHTADWHIGKTLHKQPLQDQFEFFFKWLIDIIESEKIDVLLVSGDIFDLANPSIDDRHLYYRLLKQLLHTGTKIILTGGNHDSVGLLNAPADILRELDITIIGGAKENIEEEIIEIKDAAGNITLIVAAVPFLRDRDLRSAETDKLFKNRTEAIREGIRRHYAELATICEAKYPGIPAIAMGHLYAVGAERSESERDIHVGNAAAIDTDFFAPRFNYVALGHIHRPQILGKNEFIRYSGSPVALSFSEKNDNKSVILLEIKENNIQKPVVLSVPKQRELKKISGDLEAVKDKLKHYNPEYTLPSFIEIEVMEDQYSSKVIGDVEDLKYDYSNHDKFRILLSKTIFKSGMKDTADLFDTSKHIEDLSPPEVFAKRLETEDLDIDTKDSLIDAFKELYELAQQEGGVV